MELRVPRWQMESGALGHLLKVVLQCISLHGSSVLPRRTWSGAGTCLENQHPGNKTSPSREEEERGESMGKLRELAALRGPKRIGDWMLGLDWNIKLYASSNTCSASAAPPLRELRPRIRSGARVEGRHVRIPLRIEKPPVLLGKPGGDMIFPFPVLRLPNPDLREEWVSEGIPRRVRTGVRTH